MADISFPCIQRENVLRATVAAFSPTSQWALSSGFSDILEDIYGFEASEGFILDVTDKIIPKIEEWQNRLLSEVYPVLYIDAIHYSAGDNGVVRKLAAYGIRGISNDGHKEVLNIEVSKNESSNEVARKV